LRNETNKNNQLSLVHFIRDFSLSATSPTYALRTVFFSLRQPQMASFWLNRFVELSIATPALYGLFLAQLLYRTVFSP